MSEATLPTIASAPAAPRPQASPGWLRAASRARALSWLSLVWMGAEGAIAITAGIAFVQSGMFALDAFKTYGKGLISDQQMPSPRRARGHRFESCRTRS
jgi:hypothetical protein